MLPPQSWSLQINPIHPCPSTMRSVIICLLSLLFVSALGAPAGNQEQPSSTNPSSNRLPSVHGHESRIQLAPINPPSTRPPSTRPPSTRLPSIHQLIHQPPYHQPLGHPPPPHGQVVSFQADNGRHTGVILGSQPDQQRKVRIAPVNILHHNPVQGPVFSAPYDHVVKVHENDIVGTHMMAPTAASHLMDYHAQHPPVEMHAAAPVHGSRNYDPLHESGRPGGRRRR
ncbi:hypothetical protein M378DRAFT_364708 [Amanita muscaria Koide BX008]|uniref:Uncharacterized protein n=1 Tax=Amanita muscaria (strain Koide BX008) TaxID=946122 RepID=A0A0C2WLV2_AMAMK|nr:hypothetical protein M378DRAFT_364708 [Amanita muscaria Koide BX008]